VHRRHREHARAAGHPTRVGAPVGGARCLPGGGARRGGLGQGAGSAATGGVLAHRARCADRAARPCAGHGTAGNALMSALTDLAVSTSADDRVAAATDLITTAFHSLAVSKWLVADPDQRWAAQHAQFQILDKHAAKHSTIYHVPDSTATAVWLDYTRPVPEPADYDRRLLEACG